MWPSPSCGSAPNWRGARWKLSNGRLDDDGVAALASAVAGGDDVYAGQPRHRCHGRLRVFRVGAAPEEQGQPEDDGSRRQRCQGCSPPTHRSGNITRNRQIPKRRAAAAILAASLAISLAAPAGAAAGLASHVNPFAGTRPGPGTFGGGHDFPGAALPFGMVQWSPDTTPADENGGGGYDYRDKHLRGFSLTHLSGAGCSTYGDFPFLPTTEPLESSPAAAAPPSTASFSPASRTPASRPGPATTRSTSTRSTAPASTPS